MFAILLRGRTVQFSVRREDATPARDDKQRLLREAESVAPFVVERDSESMIQESVEALGQDKS